MSASPAIASPAIASRPIVGHIAPALVPMVRTDLYFGTATPTGHVAPSDWSQFADHEITPRFPDGYSVARADGVYRMRASGETVTEPTYVLTVLYPSTERGARDSDLAAIIDAYKTTFAQESVLRLTQDTTALFA